MWAMPLGEMSCVSRPFAYEFVQFTTPPTRHFVIHTPHLLTNCTALRRPSFIDQIEHGILRACMVPARKPHFASGKRLPPTDPRCALGRSMLSYAIMSNCTIDD
jgi:hypothetical protein